RFHDRQTIVAENLAGRIGALGIFGLPHGIFLFVEYVFGIGESRHPAPVAQRGVPAGMVDVKVGAEHIVDLFVADAEPEQLVAPALLAWKVKRRRMALVLAGTGV